MAGRLQRKAKQWWSSGGAADASIKKQQHEPKSQWKRVQLKKSVEFSQQTVQSFCLCARCVSVCQYHYHSVAYEGCRPAKHSLF